MNILITDWNVFDPLKLGLALAVTLRKQYAREWKPEGILRMLGDHASYDAILAGRGIAEIEALWQNELDGFRRVRSARNTCCIGRSGHLLVFRGPDGQGSRVDVRVVRAVLVLDPLPEPLGSVGKRLGVEPAGIFIERLVEMLAARRAGCGYG